MLAYVTWGEKMLRIYGGPDQVLSSETPLRTAIVRK